MTLSVAVALAVGMKVEGGGVDLAGLYGLGALVNAAAVLWAAGVALRLRTMQAGPIMQTPVFLLLFFAPVYVPLKLLQGWIHAVATGNPITQLLEANRSLLAGQPAHVGVAYLVAAGLILTAVLLHSDGGDFVLLVVVVGGMVLLVRNLDDRRGGRPPLPAPPPVARPHGNRPPLRSASWWPKTIR